MHDGRTRKVNAPMPAMRAEFLESHRVSLTVLRGPAAGNELELEAARVVVGRGHSTDFMLDDPSVSSEHAAFELDSGGFSIRDLASTNGVHVNGAAVLSAELKHGDRIVLGNCELQYVVEQRTRPARAWSVED